MTTLKQYKEEVKKGCNKYFLWISSLNDHRRCGNIEDLKHGEHIILCPNCKRVEEAIETCEKIMNEKVEMLKKEVLSKLQLDTTLQSGIEIHTLVRIIDKIFGENK